MSGPFAIHVVWERGDVRAICGYPYSDMAWMPTYVVGGFAATCPDCDRLRDWYRTFVRCQGESCNKYADWRYATLCAECHYNKKLVW